MRNKHGGPEIGPTCPCPTPHRTPSLGYLGYYLGYLGFSLDNLPTPGPGRVPGAAHFNPLNPKPCGQRLARDWTPMSHLPDWQFLCLNRGRCYNSTLGFQPPQHGCDDGIMGKAIIPV
jgi:hypothetical protein